jgi:hypothetical protein
MAERPIEQPSFLVPSNQPLIGVFLREHGRDVVRYFAEEEAADAALPPDATENALSLAGAWSDLDWDVMQEELDRIRHESPPSPPILL